MNKHNPELSIIILSFNTKDITLQCLNSIYESSPSFPFEIIVWDNKSTDGSVEALEEYARQHENLLFIAHPENIGFGRGNNRAIEKARGQYLLLLNSDTIILDHALEKMFSFYERNEDTMHFLGMRLLNKDKSIQPSAAPFFTLPVLVGFLFLRGDRWGLTRGSPNKVRKVDWVSGACILCKKDYFDDIGGFDEGIFMYMEEVDLLYRANKKGYNTYFYPDAEIIHLGSASSTKTYPILQAYKGFLYFYRKHGNWFNLLLVKFMLKLKALVAVIIGKLTGNQYLIKTYEEAYKLVDMV